MGSLTDIDETRVAVRAAVKSVRAEWRERLGEAARLSPGSKLAKKAGVVLLDLDSLDDRIAECGGEEGFVFMVCAQVAGGAPLTDVCVHYGLHRGSVWAVLTERDEWFERYKRALAGVADDYMGQVPGIALGCSLEGVALGRFQADTLMKVAAKLDRDRFGEKTQLQISGRLTLDAVLAAMEAPVSVLEAEFDDVTPVAVPDVPAQQVLPERDYV